MSNYLFETDIGAVLYQKNREEIAGLEKRSQSLFTNALCRYLRTGVWPPNMAKESDRVNRRLDQLYELTE